MGLSFGGLAVDVGAGSVVIALLGDTADVEDAVDAPVAAEVEMVADRWAVGCARGDGAVAGAAPSSELGLAGEPERVADLDEKRRGGDRPDPGFVTQGGSVSVDELVDVMCELADRAASGSVLVDKGDEPGQSVVAGLS